MGIRKQPLVTDEYYHIYLRGVEKRNIVIDEDDIHRFLLSLNLFNTTKTIGSIYEYSFKKQKGESNSFGTPTSKLVDIVAYNLLDNHYHLILKQNIDGGISKFMQSLNGGYTKFFNIKYKRVGSLFQGAFQSRLIAGDEQLRYFSAYVNLNHEIHNFGSRSSKWGKRSSWEQYIGETNDLVVQCNLDFLISLYSNLESFRKDMLDTAGFIRAQRKAEKDLEEEEIVENLFGSRSSK